MPLSLFFFFFFVSLLQGIYHPVLFFSSFLFPCHFFFRGTFGFLPPPPHLFPLLHTFNPSASCRRVPWTQEIYPSTPPSVHALLSCFADSMSTPVHRVDGRERESIAQTHFLQSRTSPRFQRRRGSDIRCVKRRTLTHLAGIEPAFLPL